MGSAGIHITPNLGPLTQVWAPPTNCLNEITYYTGDDWAGPGMRGDKIAPSCYPDGFATDTVYSPGVCPSGWGYRGEPATGRDWTTTYDPSLTVRQCCPGTMTPLSTLMLEWCGGILPANTLYTMWGTGSDISFGSSVTTSWDVDYEVFAKPLFVAYQATDTEIFTLLPANERPSVTSTSSAAPGSTSTGGPKKTSSEPPAPSKTEEGGGGGDKGGLSKGAKVGIGVGVSLGVVLIALIAGFWIWLSRRHHQTQSTRDSTAYEPNRNTMEQAEYIGHHSPGYGYQSPEPNHGSHSGYSANYGVVKEPQEMAGNEVRPQYYEAGDIRR